MVVNDTSGASGLTVIDTGYHYIRIHVDGMQNAGHYTNIVETESQQMVVDVIALARFYVFGRRADRRGCFRENGQ